MENPPITKDNYKNVNIEELTLNSKFGSLIFRQSNEYLKKLSNWFIELDVLGYEKILHANRLKVINDYKMRFIDYLVKLQKFDILLPNPKVEHDKLENDIRTLYEHFYNDVIIKDISYLRLEMALQGKDKSKLQEDLKALSQARIEIDEALSKMRAEYATIQEEKKKVESAHGELGAKKLAKHFEGEVKQYQRLAFLWQCSVFVGYSLILLFLLVLFYHHTKTGWENLYWQEGVAKIVLFTALWYGLSFLIRNYNINSHLASINRHRAAVARTLEDFLAANPPNTGEMLQNSTQAMFKHVPIGFITKAEKDSTGPIEFISNFIEKGK